MKNLYLLSTNKPSNLFLGTNTNKLYIKPIGDIGIPQNIYITSEEKPKEGEWAYTFRGGTHRVEKAIHNDLQTWKKIILTTDIDLIKDGVQAIDDEFLEWFVKNPSCDAVKVENNYLLWKNSEKEKLSDCYKIIIPKEEPCDNCNNEVCCCIIRKQETLEEAAENYARKQCDDMYDDIGLTGASWGWESSLDFKEGAKWQQERSKADTQYLIGLLKQTTEFEVLQSFRDKVDVIGKSRKNKM